MIGDLDNALVGFAWQFALVANTKRQLAKPWAATATVVTNDAMVVTSTTSDAPVWIFVASSGGTTGTTQPVPPTLNGGTVTDNGVTWVGYRFTGVKYLTVVNTDAGTNASVGDVNLQLVPVPYANGSSGPLPPAPLSLYAISTGTPVLVVVVSQ